MIGFKMLSLNLYSLNHLTEFCCNVCSLLSLYLKHYLPSLYIHFEGIIFFSDFTYYLNSDLFSGVVSVVTCKEDILLLNGPFKTQIHPIYMFLLFPSSI